MRILIYTAFLSQARVCRATTYMHTYIHRIQRTTES